jgi:hypothetical protein
MSVAMDARGLIWAQVFNTSDLNESHDQYINAKAVYTI